MVKALAKIRNIVIENKYLKFAVFFTGILLIAWGATNFLSPKFELPQKVINYQTLGSNSSPAYAFDTRLEAERWSKRIDEVGAKGAYQEFGAIYNSNDINAQHVAIHFFGDLLYKKEGTQGLTVCEEALGFGSSCYHSFVLRAVSEKGLAGLKELDRICRDKFRSQFECQHGLGHGLIEYFGYKPENLLEALKSCEATNNIATSFPFPGCEWGAFMEYNLQVEITDKSIYLNVRKLDLEHPYEPCPIVPEKLQTTCYGGLVFWWDKFLGKNYAKFGELCNDVTEIKNKEACFFGVGLIGATLSQYDMTKIVNGCKGMPDEHSELICRIGAAISFSLIPRYQSLSQSACDGLKEDLKSYCLKRNIDFLQTTSKKAT